jgi:hypothetical protein
MQMWSRHPETIAMWFLAAILLVAVGSAPWEKVRAVHPVGVVDVTQPRFDLKLSDGLAEADHHFDARFFEIHPEGP